ncbi:hypothetical protein C2857_006102 [Epichloe festucae Fl1]|uniref:Uncharacterized protein n=1 Tax=Epichloe festucae (strain Fl1) TaxID=877507 RepID=A0A7S9KTB6_EPIFF|nr:hypothetical protein C2857_006102 [Epichloe festucae Fl1]
MTTFYNVDGAGNPFLAWLLQCNAEASYTASPVSYYPHPASPSPASSFSIISSPEVASPTQTPPIPDWEPEDEQLGRKSKKSIKKRGIRYFLYKLDECNYNKSAQRWSQFPDAQPEDVEIPGKYQTTPLMLHDRLDPSTLLQCQRCGTRCDLDYNIVDQDQDTAADEQDVAVHILSYVHCPLNSVRQCSVKSRPEWDAGETRMFQTKKVKVSGELEQHLLTMRATKISPKVFEEHDIRPVHRDIYNAYRGLRVLWHRLLLNRRIEPDYFEDDNIDSLPLWGDLMTDVTLVEKQLISHEHMELVYGITPEGADYLHRWKSEWEKELGWLNAFAGWQGRMPPAELPRCRSMAEKVGLGLKALAEAEEKLDGKYENLQRFDTAKVQARALFRGLHSALVSISSVS